MSTVCCSDALPLTTQASCLLDKLTPHLNSTAYSIYDKSRKVKMYFLNKPVTSRAKFYYIFLTRRQTKMLILFNNEGLPSPVKLESRHITFTVLAPRKTQHKKKHTKEFTIFLSVIQNIAVYSHSLTALYRRKIYYIPFSLGSDTHTDTNQSIHFRKKLTYL